MTVTLFTTVGCHLCELALEQLHSLQPQLPFHIHSVEIGDDDALIAEYGVRIPVVKCTNNAELGWPFTLPQLKAFLQVNCAEL
ncbi:MAG TPA: glutaredoxin family protein [Methylophaga sp.]|nr:glutaredoxin family protein [Methylophaga sp.]